jgi:hypothetical protein
MAIGQISVSVAFSAETTKDVDVSAGIDDARESVAVLYDDLNNIVNLTVQAISKTTYRITSLIPLSVTYRLVVVGLAPTAVSYSPNAFSPPVLAHENSYADLRTKLQLDLDLQDETFITPNELIGYFNEGIKDAEAEIMKINEEYFLTSTPLPAVVGRSGYAYPDNIYAYKVRGLVYSNGTEIYDIRRWKRMGKFEHLALTNQSGSNDAYRWFHTNDSAGQGKINLVPASRETANLSPLGNAFAPITVWYIRRANRVPLLGQYVKNWDVVDQTGIDLTADTIPVSSAYVTGDKVKLTTSGTMPAGLSSSTIYYAIAGSGIISLATTLQNALAGTKVDITAKGLGNLSISIAANQSIVDNTLIDIPEFTEYVLQFVKCRCMEKEGDPRLDGAAKTLVALKDQLTSTLSEMQPDDENQVEQDLSSYSEMS